MATSRERDYQSTHPWISFQLDLRQANPRLWVLLGQIVAFGEFVSRALLPPKVASEMARIYLAKGVQATVAIEGNTLSEEQVLAQIDKQLELPASKEYLGREVRNVVDAANEIVKRIYGRDAPLVTAQFVADCNRRILTGLSKVLADEVEPGHVRRHSVGVGGYRGAPAQDCGYLLDRLGKLAGGDSTDHGPRHRIGQSRCDLCPAGGTGPSLHRLDPPLRGWQRENGQTRGAIPLGARPPIPIGAAPEQPLQRHSRPPTTGNWPRSSQAGQRRGDPIGFLLYALQGLSDGLREQCGAVTRVHHESAWKEFVFDQFDQERPSSAMRRRRKLLLELPPPSNPVRKEMIPFSSQELTRLYVGLSVKTLLRDLTWLTRKKLVVRSLDQYHANRDLMRAFALPKAPPTDN